MERIPKVAAARQPWALGRSSVGASRAWLRTLLGQPDLARADLDEAQQIAERGPMRLHMADIHLHRARLL